MVERVRYDAEKKGKELMKNECYVVMDCMPNNLVMFYNVLRMIFYPPKGVTQRDDVLKKLSFRFCRMTQFLSMTPNASSKDVTTALSAFHMIIN